VSTSLYPTAGTDKKLTANGQLRKNIFREIKKSRGTPQDVLTNAKRAETKVSALYGGELGI
jgi:hypothetical protein